jgi:hypothetical protein
MAAMAVVEEVEDTEAFEAPDASLSVRVECLCMFVLVGNVVSSRYRQCHQVENPDMSKPIESRVSTNEAVKVVYKVWMHNTSLGKINTESERVVELLK